MLRYGQRRRRDPQRRLMAEVRRQPGMRGGPWLLMEEKLGAQQGREVAEKCVWVGDDLVKPRDLRIRTSK